MQEPTPAQDGGPLTAQQALVLSHACIAGLIARLRRLAAEVAVASPPGGLPDRAQALVTDLDKVLGVHLVDEETDIFPAVLAAKSPGRHAQAFALVSSLLIEHRELTEQWHALRIALLATGGGISVPFSAQAALDFASRLDHHLECEETELLDLLDAMDPDRLRLISAAITERHAEALQRARDGS